MILVESIEGCEDCAAEEAWKLSQGHDCGPSSPKWSTLCESMRASREMDQVWHDLTHQPERCENCNLILDDHRSAPVFLTQLCPSGQCEEWRCPHCGDLNGSSGPIDCPSCGSMRDVVE